MHFEGNWGCCGVVLLLHNTPMSSLSDVVMDLLHADGVPIQPIPVYFDTKAWAIPGMGVTFIVDFGGSVADARW